MPCPSVTVHVRRHQAMTDPAAILADCEQVRAHAAVSPMLTRWRDSAGDVFTGVAW